MSDRRARLRVQKQMPSPVEALQIGRDLMAKGLFHVMNSQLPVDLAELGYPGDELMTKALDAAFREAGPEYHQPDSNPQGDPAYIFVWQSKFFQKRIYLKFKLLGTRRKPVLWLCSCHPAYFEDKA